MKRQRVRRVVEEPEGGRMTHIVDAVESLGIVGDHESGNCGLSLRIKGLDDPIYIPFVDEKHLRGFIADLTETLRLVWPAGDA